MRIPNLISSYRLVVAPIVVHGVATGRWRKALWLCMGAFLSDLMDGFWARRSGDTSESGGEFDVFCDRTVIMAPIVGMSLTRDLPSWFATAMGASVYSVDVWASGRLDAANAVLWGSCYALTARGAYQHLEDHEFRLFAGLTVGFMAAGALTHTELVSSGVGELSNDLLGRGRH